MENGEEEILMFDLQMAMGDATGIAAQSITDEIYQHSSRLNKLRQVIQSRRPTDPEVKYVHKEFRRLDRKIAD